MSESDTAKDAGDGKTRKASKIQWQDGAMRTDFANVVNIQGTREQIEFFFGTNRSWDGSGDGDVTVDLTNRLILTPFAAKRMHRILTTVLREYESRHGILKVEDS